MPESVPAGRDRFARGAAFIEGQYVPMAEARIPVLDWGMGDLGWGRDSKQRDIRRARRFWKDYKENQP